jgi:enoyl-CoA hydratase/carnithine racemase
MTERVRVAYEGPIAVITNDNPDKHNAFDDEMDLRLFDILAEIRERPDVRAVVWRGEASPSPRGATSRRSGASRWSCLTISS